MDRRTLLRLLGATTASGLAGCTSLGEQDDRSTPTDAPKTTPTPTDTDTETNRPQPTTDGLVVVTADQRFDATVDRIRADIDASNASLLTLSTTPRTPNRPTRPSHPPPCSSSATRRPERR